MNSRYISVIVTLIILLSATPWEVAANVGPPPNTSDTVAYSVPIPGSEPIDPGDPCPDCTCLCCLGCSVSSLVPVVSVANCLTDAERCAGVLVELPSSNRPNLVFHPPRVS